MRTEGLHSGREFLVLPFFFERESCSLPYFFYLQAVPLVSQLSVAGAVSPELVGQPLLVLFLVREGLELALADLSVGRGTVSRRAVCPRVGRSGRRAVGNVMTSYRRKSCEVMAPARKRVVSSLLALVAWRCVSWRVMRLYVCMFGWACALVHEHCLETSRSGDWRVLVPGLRGRSLPVLGIVSCFPLRHCGRHPPT